MYKRQIQRLYKNNVNYVIGKNMRLLGFTTNYGLRQGGGLSPTSFNLYMDDIIKKCSLKVRKMHVGYRNLQSIEDADVYKRQVCSSCTADWYKYFIIKFFSNKLNFE